MATDESLERWLQSCPDAKAPEGFVRRVMERASAPEPVAPANPLRIYGMVCIASALVMPVVIHSSLPGAFTQLLNALKGVF